MPQWDWHVSLVDENGTAVSVGGGTQYADGATQANPTGNVALWLDTSNVLRAASAAKPLPVNIISGAGGTVTDAAAWTTAVSSFVPAGGVFNDSATDLTAGQQGTLRMTAKRAQHINLRNASAAEIGIAAAPLVVGGAKTNNNAAPGATNVGVLPVLANAATPSWTEGNLVALSSDLAGALRVNATLAGTVSTANSSAVALTGGAAFTGTSEDVSGYSSIEVSVFADQASATGGLSLQLSSDGTNWDHTRVLTVAASVGQALVITPNARFFRIVYTNGATPQTAFRLQTVYRAVPVNLASASFQDVNGSQNTTAFGQRVFADLMIQDATGNATNRMRSARDLAASPGLGGTLAAMGAGGHDGTSWRPILVSTTGQLAIAQGTVGPAKIEDAGHTSGDVGDFMLAVRQDTQSALAGTTLDYIPFTTDQNGSLRGVSGGYTTVLTSTLTRPADTTAYAAGDEMTDTGGAIQTITGAARFSGGSGIIQGVYVSQSTLWTTKPAMEIWVYDTTSTPVADNGAFAPTDGVTDTCIAVIPVTATYAGTVNQALDSGQISVPFLTSGSANLFFRVVIRNAAQDSANSGVTKFRWRILQD
jgi:hypothetical protein